MIDTDDVRAAAQRIGTRVRRTPVLQADRQLWFKLEHTQHAGSFKTRGMFNQILAAAERGALPPAGIVTASGGNAGLAAAYAARELGVAAEVYAPETAPAVKVAKLRKLGARVVQAGNEYAEAYTQAVLATEASGALFCHAYDDPAMVAGNGTIGLELAEQLPGFDTVLVAVGGGGLIAGVIAALRDRARVVGVEPITSAALSEALRTGEPVDVPVAGVAADSLGARRAGRIAFELARDAGIGSVLVDDKAIVDARRRLWEDYRLAVEHGTAAALAAMTSGAYLPAPGERVVVLLCGANTNPADLTA
ncbi:threonine/serine dehydratase [Paractinoplanes rishiriensis]|uniref:Threonine dehydratase n=1 Tax=Paractinoplanes rishiriensis TaxID=1050105 RepID=A0A919K0N5_9ACTN|nr:threonine/serine dehydratase [Actinoplanes rishiriensis]GIE96717.1 threonine dehydratase [Actinoplanes rishiriensis]